MLGEIKRPVAKRSSETYWIPTSACYRCQQGTELTFLVDSGAKSGLSFLEIASKGMRELGAVNSSPKSAKPELSPPE
jgi:hypothetical protein